MRTKNHLLLFLILITGTALRLLFINEIPFTSDELSTLGRLHFDSFSELMSKGIGQNSDPAGLQVFLFFWTRCFGWSEIALKLPFVVMGIAAILLIYLIGKELYNETIGLMSAAFLATMQFAIMFSQIAQPYGSGLFLCLAMVYFWSKLVYKPSAKYGLYSGLYIFSAALCAYNHYFSMLFAAIVALTGLFFVRKKQLLYYALSVVAIFILYLPHLNITLSQLDIQGTKSLLSRPPEEFLLNFTEYLFHYSTFVYLLVVALFIIGINKLQGEKFNTRMLAVSLAWFFLPLAAGFLYSKYVADVLQVPIFIFSFPFVFFILFGHWCNQKFSTNAAIVAAVMLVNITSLVMERRHFQLIVLSPCEQIVKEHHLAQQAYPGKVLSLVDSDPEITAYYISKNNIPTNFTWQNTSGSLGDFSAFINEQRQQYEYLYFGAFAESNPVLIPIIQDFYPNIVWQKNYSGGTAYLFSQHDSSTQKPFFLSVQDYEKELPGWVPGDAKSITNSLSFTGKHSYRMDSTQEYSPAFSAPIKDLFYHKNNFIDISVRFYAEESDMRDILLVSSLETTTKPVNRQMVPFTDYMITLPDSIPGWTSVYLSFRLSTININKRKDLLNIYIWNKTRKTFYVDDFEIRTRQGNPVINGLYEKF